jgi:hypothetical protein
MGAVFLCPSPKDAHLSGRKRCGSRADAASPPSTPVLFPPRSALVCFEGASQGDRSVCWSRSRWHLRNGLWRASIRLPGWCLRECCQLVVGRSVLRVGWRRVGVNARIRRAVRARGHFPNEAAALKCIYMALMSLDPTGKGRKRWTMRWKAPLNAFQIAFEGRLTPANN